jgi:hypothetical protein
MAKDEEFPILVERRLKIRVPQSGKEQDLVIRIGKPYRTGNEGDAACPVFVGGLFGRLADVHGVDEMDALRLAIELIENTLRGKRKELRISWPDGEPYFDN